MEPLIDKVAASFVEAFSSEPGIIACAPGRVNIIGEHTDYTGGFVLPGAINREVVFAVKAVPGKTITGVSIDFNEQASFRAGAYNPKHSCGWLRYIMGVLLELEKLDKKIEGFVFSVGGNVPIGSGLSSSAALEMAVCKAMEGLLEFRLDDMKAALLCQRAENTFVGVNCGIMDQYISRIGRKDHAVRIDCTDLSTQAIPVNTSGYSWLVIDSKKRRGLVDSEYNQRRKECEEGLKSARLAFPDRPVNGLRDVAVEDMERLRPFCDTSVFKRVRHVVTENDRVLGTVRALEAGDIEAVGSNLYSSHESLRDDFEVSCGELNLLVNILSKVDGVTGARLTGAGFGGCVIALIRNDAVEAVREAVRERYHPESLPKSAAADIWPIAFSEGARLVKR